MEVGALGAHLSSLHLEVITTFWLATAQTTSQMGIWVQVQQDLACHSGAPLPTTGAGGGVGRKVSDF